MRKIISTLLLFIPASLFAQSIDMSVIAAAGDYFTNSSTNYSLSWTLGETATATLESETFILTQGFQQVFLDGTGIDDFSPIISDISVYPNPTSSKLNIRFTKFPSQQFKIACFDILGRLVAVDNYDGDVQEPEQVVTFAMDKLSHGLYVVRVICNNKLLHSEKVIKE